MFQWFDEKKKLKLEICSMHIEKEYVDKLIRNV